MTRPQLVGSYIKRARQLKKLSQKDLAAAFHPPVTVQFISNLERGISLLPLNQLARLQKALGLDEWTLLDLLVSEYTLKLSLKLAELQADETTPGKSDKKSKAWLKGGGSATSSVPWGTLVVEQQDVGWIRNFYHHYRLADKMTKQVFFLSLQSLIRAHLSRGK